MLSNGILAQSSGAKIDSPSWSLDPREVFPTTARTGTRTADVDSHHYTLASVAPRIQVHNIIDLAGGNMERAW